MAIKPAPKPASKSRHVPITPEVRRMKLSMGWTLKPKRYGVVQKTVFLRRPLKPCLSLTGLIFLQRFEF